MGGTEKGNAVQNPHTAHATQNRVMAMFESGAAVFELPRAATFADLAGRLAHLSEGHDGALMSVDVRVGWISAMGKPSLRTGTLGDPRMKPAATLLRSNRRRFLGGGGAK
jgi:hypothetical protein